MDAMSPLWRRRLTAVATTVGPVARGSWIAQVSPIAHCFLPFCCFVNVLAYRPLFPDASPQRCVCMLCGADAARPDAK